MTVTTNLEAPQDIPGLDERFYSLDSEELAFFLKETRIDTESALKSHLIDVQARAYKVYPYPCIRRFNFTKIKISRLPAYQNALKLGRERQNAVFLDIGCCFGNDTRKIIADGFPVEGVLASDIQTQFWDLGHKLFRSTPETFTVPFITGDVFDPLNLEPISPFNDAPKTPIPTLSTLTSLNPLRGHVSVIHASSLFHLFGEEKQFKLARALAALLSPEPGSIIFGSHGGLPEKGMRKTTFMGTTRFCHSAESWQELWDGQIFNSGTVKVEASVKRADLREPSMPEQAVERFWLVWSVTRL